MIYWICDYTGPCGLHRVPIRIWLSWDYEECSWSRERLSRDYEQSSVSRLANYMAVNFRIRRSLENNHTLSQKNQSESSQGHGHSRGHACL